MDNHERRRGHFYRGRRGSDRRGIDRRTQPQAQERQGRDQVDVDQIMREIRGRIAQRQGVDLTGEQLQDLAARRLEAILDPRAIKPSLLEGLRRTAGTATPAATPKASAEPVYTFEDTTIYDSHRAILRFIRRLLNPLLKLFFNPNPLIRALHLQARLNVEAAARESDRDRLQTEWNALHYEILQRLVTEISRLSLEAQALSTHVESLAARVDFADRRVRGLEGAMHQRPTPTSRPVDVAPAPRPSEAGAAPEVPVPGDTPQGEGPRRRRRRRRGRRGGVGPMEGGHVAPGSVPSPAQPGPATDAGAEQGAMAAAAEPEPVIDAAFAGAESERLAEPEPHEAAPAPEPSREEHSVAVEREPALRTDDQETDRSDFPDADRPEE